MAKVEPIVGLGTTLPQGTVVSINRDSVTVEKEDGSEDTLSFAQVEQLFFKE